jgi:hypothetical protein
MNERVTGNGGMILAGETEVPGEKHYTEPVEDERTSKGRLHYTSRFRSIAERHRSVKFSHV